MKHIGLLCLPASGHINPMSSLGQELQRRGYTVSLIGIPDSRDKALSACLGYIPIGTSSCPSGTLTQALTRLGKLYGIRALRLTLRQIVSFSNIVLRDAATAITDAGVDALLVDQTVPAGGAVADKLNLPYVTVCVALLIYGEPNIPPPTTHWPYKSTVVGRLRNRLGYALSDLISKPLRISINAQRASWGLPPIRRNSLGESPLAQISQQPKGFDFPRSELPPVFHYTGPFFEGHSDESIDFPWERLTGKPLIYASMGTQQNRITHTFSSIAAACQDLDFQLVISLGDKNQEFASEYPGSPLVVPFAPQMELLNRAVLAITSSGLNTAMQTLSYGIPMVVIPIANEQPGIAARLKYIGAGEIVKFANLNPSRLRDTVLRILNDGRYRECAMAMKREMSQINGVKRAADIVEQAFLTRKPVLRLS